MTKNGQPVTVMLNSFQHLSLSPPQEKILGFDFNKRFCLDRLDKLS